MQNQIKDITIIGAGPVGLFAIFQAGMLQMSCNVIESLPFVGGQCSALYPDKPIYDIPGYPKILAQDLIDQLKKQSDPFKATYYMEQRALSINLQNDIFTIETSLGNKIMSKAVIISAGGGSLEPNRLPFDVEALENKKIFYAVKNSSIFNGSKILIAGGGDSAVDWAINLCENANVEIVHRRKEFTAAPDNVSKMHSLEGQNQLAIYKGMQLENVSFSDINDKLVVTLHNITDDSSIIKEYDYILAFYGIKKDLMEIKNWGLNIEKNHICVDHFMRTNIDKIYAIGDMALSHHQLKLILTGFSEAAVACHDIYAKINNRKAKKEYSTTKGISALI